MRVIIAGLLGGLVIFIWGAVSHMALPLGEMGMAQPANEDAVIAVMQGNAANARKLIAAVAPKLGPDRQNSPLGIENMLDVAVMTAPDKRDPALMAKLDAVAGRILKK